MINQTDVSPELFAFVVMFYLYQNVQHQNQKLQTQVDILQIENKRFLWINQSQKDEISELQCLQHPNSLDGDAICNFD